MEPRFGHVPSIASDHPPPNEPWCAVLALIGVSTLPHVRCATCKASVQRIVTGQQLSLVLQTAYRYKHARMHTLFTYIKATLEDQRRPRPLDRTGKNFFIEEQASRLLDPVRLIGTH